MFYLLENRITFHDLFTSVSPDTCPVFKAPTECPEEKENLCEDDTRCSEGFKCCFTGCGLECVDRFGNTGPAVTPRSGTCPVLKAPTECPEENENLCEDDSSCSEGFKCCFTGCGLECVDRFGNTRPAVTPRPGTCPVFKAPTECPEENENLCEDDSSCSEGFKCCFTGCGLECVDGFGNTGPAVTPRPGTCPVFKAPTECPEENENLCEDDSSCSEGFKCCFTGCGLECVDRFGNTGPAVTPRSGTCPVLKAPTECPEEREDFCKNDSTCPNGSKCCNSGCEFRCVGKCRHIGITCLMVQCRDFNKTGKLLTRTPRFTNNPLSDMTDKPCTTSHQLSRSSVAVARSSSLMPISLEIMSG